jgi:hypothetical protein
MSRQHQPATRAPRKDRRIVNTWHPVEHIRAHRDTPKHTMNACAYTHARRTRTKARADACARTRPHMVHARARTRTHAGTPESPARTHARTRTHTHVHQVKITRHWHQDSESRVAVPPGLPVLHSGSSRHGESLRTAHSDLADAWKAPEFGDKYHHWHQDSEQGICPSAGATAIALPPLRAPGQWIPCVSGSSSRARSSAWPVPVTPVTRPSHFDQVHSVTRTGSAGMRWQRVYFAGGAASEAPAGID